VSKPTDIVVSVLASIPAATAPPNAASRIISVLTHAGYAIITPDPGPGGASI
jgi:hypothetical protein